MVQGRSIVARKMDNRMKKAVCVFGFIALFFYFTSQNREERVWESLYISQLIPFEKLEQISVKRTGFLQSATVKVIARISENENLSEILYALRNGEFDDFEETEEHLFFSASQAHSPHYPLFIEFSKEMRVVSVYWFHL